MYLAAPGVDVGCGVVEWDADGEVRDLFNDIKNELAAVQLPLELFIHPAILLPAA